MDKKKSQLSTAFSAQWKSFLLLSLSLGLMPFVPEPHIWGKLEWLLGGAQGMQAMDWFDFFLHGTPWLLLLVALGLKLGAQVSKSEQEKN
ncbi:hypothetical protein [Algoriphagus namhaensis]